MSEGLGNMETWKALPAHLLSFPESAASSESHHIPRVSDKHKASALRHSSGFLAKPPVA